MNDTTRLTTADTAKLIRAALKPAFPDVKFSVRSSVYSMGSSIDVRWTDGPTARDVDAIVKPFAGATFDGMTDLKEYKRTPLPGQPAHIRSGCDFVFTHREHSPALKAEAERRVTRWFSDYVRGSMEFERQVRLHLIGAEVLPEIVEETSPEPETGRNADVRRAVLDWALRCETFDDALQLADAREVLTWIYNTSAGATPHAPLGVAVAQALSPEAA